MGGGKTLNCYFTRNREEMDVLARVQKRDKCNSYEMHWFCVWWVLLEVLLFRTPSKKMVTGLSHRLPDVIFKRGSCPRG